MRFLLTLVSFLIFFACDDDSKDTTGNSGGTPAGAGMPAGAEGGTPAGAEGGTPAGAEGGTPAGAEGGTPAGAEGGTPAGAEGGTPAGTEGGMPAGAEGGTPAGAEGGTPAGAEGGTPAGMSGGMSGGMTGGQQASMYDRNRQVDSLSPEEQQMLCQDRADYFVEQMASFVPTDESKNRFIENLCIFQGIATNDVNACMMGIESCKSLYGMIFTAPPSNCEENDPALFMQCNASVQTYLDCIIDNFAHMLTVITNSDFTGISCDLIPIISSQTRSAEQEELFQRYINLATQFNASQTPAICMEINRCFQL